MTEPMTTAPQATAPQATAPQATAPQTTVLTPAAMVSCFEDWEDRISSTFVPLRARRLFSDGDFQGGVGSVALGPVTLAEVAVTNTVVERTPRLIRRDDPEFFKFGLQVAGTSVVEQEGRQARLVPGDLVIYDTSRPYRIVCDEQFRMTVAMFPRRLVGLPEQRLAALTAVRLAGDVGLGSLIGPLLRGLGADLNPERPIVATHLGNAIVDLVTAAFAQQLGEPLESSASASTSTVVHRELLARVATFIDEHLHDPGLSSATVAAAHYISVRSLQKLFEAEGTSVSALIRSRRLEHCRRDLMNPVHLATSVAEIGYRWGFTDPAHFSRLFRKTFGVSPRAFRRSQAA